MEDENVDASNNDSDDFISSLEDQVNSALKDRMDVDDDDGADEVAITEQTKKAQRDPELQGISLLAHWNLVDYLPEQLQEPFEVIIGEFILNPWKWRKKS